MSLTVAAAASAMLNIVLIIVADMFRQERNQAQDDTRWWKKNGEEYRAERDRYFEALLKLSEKPAPKAKAKRARK